MKTKFHAKNMKENYILNYFYPHGPRISKRNKIKINRKIRK